MPSKLPIDVDDASSTSTYGPSQLPTPPYSSGQTSPTLQEPEEFLEPSVPAKKKKKKKPKKSTKAKDAAAKNKETPSQEPRPPVLCISRNKHWRYISSYHGPWLQLPIEILESLLGFLLDPTTHSPCDSRSSALCPPCSSPATNPKSRDRGFHGLTDHAPPELTRKTVTTTISPSHQLPAPKPGRAAPPPIDPGVFRSVTTIRKLIDEAAELSVRAASGLSSAPLGSARGGGMGGMSNSSWNMAHAFGLNPSADGGGGGRNVTMSATRIHRLRALAIQKLAQAYKADEIASSVMVMQGGTVFDDVAERVLRVDPNDADARYVHFFHEKIPSRQLAESTTTQVLDELIDAQPQRLEFYRTRGIVHCFRDEFSQATKDFTYALKEARAARKAKAAHRSDSSRSGSPKRNINRKRGVAKSNGQAPPSGTSAVADATASTDTTDGEMPLSAHPSIMPDAPDPIEPQLLFLRGAAFLQHAMFLVEEAVLKLEGIHKTPSVDGTELRLCYIENGRYGGVEMGHTDGPLGKKDGAKVKAYCQVLADTAFKEQVHALVKKSMRDHERFLSHFDSLEGADQAYYGDLARRVECAFVLLESSRPGHHANASPTLSGSDLPAVFTTYHPLLVESHFSILICQLILGEFEALLPAFVRTAALVHGLDGCPVFSLPRSMAQAEFVEVLEVLAAGWRNGTQPCSHSLNSFGKLAIEAPPPPPTPAPSSEQDPDAPSTSAAGAGPSGGQNGSQRAPTPAVDLIKSLDRLRILLAPVATRQRQRSEKAAAEKASGAHKKPLQISIPLHGTRVEIVLAWLAAVHLGDLDSVA